MLAWIMDTNDLRGNSFCKEIIWLLEWKLIIVCSNSIRRKKWALVPLAIKRQNIAYLLLHAISFCASVSFSQVPVSWEASDRLGSFFCRCSCWSASGNFFPGRHKAQSLSHSTAHYGSPFSFWKQEWPPTLSQPGHFGRFLHDKYYAQWRTMVMEALSVAYR